MSRGSTSGKVVFVGAGPGDPGLLTVRATQVLADADAVMLDHACVDADCEEIFRTICGPDVEVLEVGCQGGQPITRAARTRIMSKAAKEGRLVVRLLNGDGSTFSGLAEEMAGLSKADVPFEVVPGVSVHTAVPLYAGVSPTSAKSASMHVVDVSRRFDASGLTSPHSAVVLIGDRHQLSEAAAELVHAGRDAAGGVVITSHGSRVGQHSVHTRLGELGGTVAELPAQEWQGALVAVCSTTADAQCGSWFESRPLFGWQVLVPRTQAQAGPTVDALAHYGATASIVPTISVEPPRTPHQMDKAVKGLVTGRYEWVGFTSVNAVRAIKDRYTTLGLDARAFSGLKVAAVGGVTAEALREWGIEPDLVPTGEQSAKGLLEDWPPYDRILDPINRVLLPRADIATDTLIAGLQEMGWEVDDVTAYRTVRAAPPQVEIRDAIKNGSFDAVLFTSSSTVRNLVGIAGKPHVSTAVACIGPATAKTAEDYGLRVDVLAAEASSLALVDALAEFGAGLRHEAVAAGEPVLRPSERRPAYRRHAR
ncbi:MAG: bifunctional uroporphyrinogen-III C-methyltransferase/uroporphyrinogen-III synthase [Micrococcales bacterium]|nr:MAG: bifunctional uroporphyrinogen-III C-methyltransferase/uroporphyrinogen-III synthase [Micrococcales bacterium]PIE25923.1 MAG: bifunctional uroporphyrinogen-III C-methyltransferase/uroporphyrinogen-III synthase [Micrococcales bacterium]